MTRPTILLISLLLGCQLQAQTFADWFGGPSRKELHSENDRLRESLDSLQILVDSLEQSYSQVESELFALIEGNSPEADSVVVEYTPEMTDSLLHLWYKNTTDLYHIIYSKLSKPYFILLHKRYMQFNIYM